MPYTAMYRRYRPDNFDGMVGQDALIKTLKSQVMANRINHAYLFCGPRGIGKTTAARIMAKSINCKNPNDGNFCGECSSCLALNNQNNFDIVEIDAASNNKVDNIRDLRENIKFMPVSGKYRVYIIDEVHMLSNSAFNALLKTLEEPPAHIVFIMATTEPNKLPVTVLSRCQRFDFNRISTQKLVGLLQEIATSANIKIDKNAIGAIARASEGGARDAISLLDQCFAFGSDNISIKDVSQMLGSANKLLYFALGDAIIKSDISRALGGLNSMVDSGCNVLSIASDIMSHFRDLFMCKHVSDIALALSVDDATATRYEQQSSQANDSMLLRCMELFSTLESDLRYASQPRIWVELALAKACRSENDNSYDDLIDRIERLEKSLENALEKASKVNLEKNDEYMSAFEENTKSNEAKSVDKPKTEEKPETINKVSQSKIIEDALDNEDKDVSIEHSGNIDTDKESITETDEKIEDVFKEVNSVTTQDEFFTYSDPPPADYDMVYEDEDLTFTNVFDDNNEISNNKVNNDIKTKPNANIDIIDKEDTITADSKEIKESIEKISLIESVSQLTNGDNETQDDVQENADNPNSKKNAIDLWNKAMDKAKANNNMGVCMSMKKGKATALEGALLKVIFPPDGASSVKRLSVSHANKVMLESLEAVHGKPVNVDMVVQKLSKDSLDFMDDLSSKFPGVGIKTKYD